MEAYTGVTRQVDLGCHTLQIQVRMSDPHFVLVVSGNGRHIMQQVRHSHNICVCVCVLYTHVSTHYQL